MLRMTKLGGLSLGGGSLLHRAAPYKPYINYSWTTSVSSDYITDGVELVTNGGFDTDTWWTKGTGWSISDGKANHTSSAGYLSKSSLLESGVLYKVTVTVYESGFIQFPSAFYTESTTLYEGTNTVYITPTSSNLWIYGNSTVSIDNISVQKVIQKPNEVVSKNIGSGKVPVKWYSGNPLDFQGSQSIDGILNGVSYPISISCRCSNVISGHILSSDYALSERLYIYVSSETYYIRFGNMSTLNTNITATSNDLITVILENGSYSFKVNDQEVSGTFTLNYNGTTNDISIGEDANDSPTFDGQLDNLVIYNGILTPTQIQQSYTNPNAFYYEMVNDDNTLFCTDFGGTGGYIPNDVNKSIVEKIPTYHYTTFGNPVGTSSYNNGVLSVEVTTVGTTNYQPLCIFTIPTTLSGTYREITINYTVNSGTCIISNYNDGSNTSLNKTLSESGSYTFIDLCANDSTTIRFDFDGRNLFSIDFSVEVKEISGIYPITNYSPTMRTNYQTESTGMQELLIERDSLGFFLGLREFPKGNGVGYAMIPNDTRATDITIQTKPDSLSGNILSGGVTLDTTGLTAGVDNDITLSNQTISADIKMFDGYTGEIKIYKEDLV